jgi:flagellar hook-associated protein 3 FlgL
MAIARMTQNIMMGRSYQSLQTVSSKLSRSQEQLTTGRVLNRPSDSPTDTTAAMRIRAELSDQAQYARNAEDGLGFLGQTDSTLMSMLDQVRRARDLALQGASATNQHPQALAALAAEVDQLREGMVSSANATYLGRPVFGGLVNGSAAFGSDGGFVGVVGEVNRTVAKDVKVRINVNGPDVFGPDGDNLFQNLAKLSDALRTGDVDTIRAQVGSLDTAQGRLTSAVSEVGTRMNRLERASQAAEGATLDLTTSLSNIENVDLTKATIDLKMQEVAYQAALSATARLVQPSLADFLR